MAEISRILKPGGVFVATTFLSPIPYFGNNDIRKVCRSNWICTLKILSFNCTCYYMELIFTTPTCHWVQSIYTLRVITCNPYVLECTKQEVWCMGICKLQVLKTAARSSTIRYWDEIELQELCTTCGLVDYSQIRRNTFIMVSARKSP